MKDIVLLVSQCLTKQYLSQSVAISEALKLDGEDVSSHRISSRFAIIEVHRAIVKARRSHFAKSMAGAMAYSGYVQPAYADPRDLMKLVKTRGPSIHLKESPGGIAAFFYVDALRSQAFAWQGLSNAERIFYTVGPDAIAVSNSPLLSHCIANGTSRPEANRQWLEDAVVGCPVVNTTHFAGTMALPAETALRVSPGKVAQIDFPLSIERHIAPRRDTAALDHLHQELLRALTPLETLNKVYFRLSGGKDSRLIAALLADGGIEPHTVTHGSPQSPEAAIAVQVGEAVGLHVDVLLAPLVGEDGLALNAAAQMRHSDGLFLNPQQLVSDDSPELAGFDVLIEGNAHHLRGGFASPVRTTKEMGWQNLSARFAGDADFASPQLRDMKLKSLRRIYNDLLKNGSAQKALYWAYAYLRMTGVIQPYFRRKTRTVVGVYPLMDERVILATHKLHIRDLNSDEACYRLLTRLAPAATRLPLYQNEWRFVPHSLASQIPRMGSGKARPRRRIDQSLPAAVDAFNSLDARVDTRCLTDIPSFHGATLSDPDIRANGMGEPRNTKFVWKLVSLSLATNSQLWLP